MQLRLLHGRCVHVSAANGRALGVARRERGYRQRRRNGAQKYRIHLGSIGCLSTARGADLLALVDDVGGDQDQQIALFFAGIGLCEETPDERQVRQERNA